MLTVQTVLVKNFWPRISRIPQKSQDFVKIFQDFCINPSKSQEILENFSKHYKILENPRKFQQILEFCFFFSFQKTKFCLCILENLSKSQKILGNPTKSQKILACPRKSQEIQENHRKSQETLEKPRKFQKFSINVISVC